MRWFISMVALVTAGAALAAPPRTVTLQVQNMTCATCPIVVRKALEQMKGVHSANVDFSLKTAAVTFDPEQVTPTALAQATANAGFPSTVRASP